MNPRRWLYAIGAAACLGAATGLPPLSLGLDRSAPPPAVREAVPVALGQAPTAPDPCSVPLAAAGSVARGLPWPVVLETGCGRFSVFPDGLVTRAAADPGGASDSGYRIPAGPRAWAEVQQGHLVFIRDRQAVWSSVALYDPQQVEGAVLGPGWVSFSVYVPGGDFVQLFFAVAGQGERPAGVNEDPLTATPWGGLLTDRWRGQSGRADLIVRGPSGRVVGTAASRVSPLGPEWGGTVLYRQGGRVMRTDGRTSTVFAAASWLGPARYVGLTNLEDGRLVLTGPDRVEVVLRDGSVQARGRVAGIPRGGWGYVGAFMTVEPRSGAVLVTATHWSDRNAGGGQGWEGVYRLAPGADRAQLLYGRNLDIAVCAHSASFSWHRRWLLYSACEGRVVAIDTTGRQVPVELTSVARHLPVLPGDQSFGVALLGADWAGPDPSGRPTPPARIA